MDSKRLLLFQFLQCYVIKQMVNAIACTIEFFTITAEIYARSLANFYCQYADRHMNLKIMRRVASESGQFDNLLS